MKFVPIILGAFAMLIIAAAGTSATDCSLCGDLNGDGQVNIADLTAFVDWYTPPFGPEPECPGSADVNCDNAVTFGQYPGTDLQYLIDYMFNGGPAPCADCP